jgi:hypothetical protein
MGLSQLSHNGGLIGGAGGGVGGAGGGTNIVE